MTALKARPRHPSGPPGIVPGKYPSSEVNRELGRRVRAAAAALESLRRGPVAFAVRDDFAKLVALVRTIRDGVEASRALVEGNLALAVNLGQDAATRTGREADDCVGDAMVGLVVAGSGYDPDRYGTVFSTHATWQIRATIEHGCRADARVRGAGLGRCVFWGHGVAPRDDLRRSGRGRFDSRPGHDDGHEADDASDQLDRLMTCLTAREADVIARRHGLGGRPRQTLAGIGRDLGVSKERVRQIEQRAMCDLRKAAAAMRAETAKEDE